MPHVTNISANFAAHLVPTLPVEKGIRGIIKQKKAMKKILKIAVLMMATIVATGIFVSCGDDDEPDGSEYGKPVNFRGTMTIMETTNPAVTTIAQNMEITRNTANLSKLAFYKVDLFGNPDNLVDLVLDEVATTDQKDLFRTVYNGSAKKTININGVPTEVTVSMNATEQWTGKVECLTTVVYPGHSYSLSYEGKR